MHFIKFSVKLNEAQSTHALVCVFHGLGVEEERTAASGSRNTRLLASHHLPEIANTSGPHWNRQLTHCLPLHLCPLRIRSVGVELVYHRASQTCIL